MNENGISRRTWSAICYLVFSGLVEFAIVASAAQMGACTGPVSHQARSMCRGAEQFFTAVFLLELIIKLFIERVAYFRDSWNLLDVVLVGLAVFDSWILPLVLPPKPAFNLEWVRILRLMRLVRILKMFRTKQELRMLLEGLVASFKSMFWVGILLATSVYVAAIIGMSFFMESESVSQKNFATLPDAMLTMFTVCVLADWSEIVPTLMNEFWWSAYLFLGLTMFCSFGMLNLIIGVITERTALVQQSYAADRAHARKCLRMKKVEEAAQIIFGTDDDDVRITLDDLEKLRNEPDSGQVLDDVIRDVHLPLGYTVSDLHQLLDSDSSGSLTRAEFVEGMDRLLFGGDFQQRCILLHAVHDVTMHTERTIQCMQRQICDELSAVKADIQVLRFKLGAASVASIPAGVQHKPLQCPTREPTNLESEVSLTTSHSEEYLGVSSEELLQAIHRLWGGGDQPQAATPIASLEFGIQKLDALRDECGRFQALEPGRGSGGQPQGNTVTEMKAGQDPGHCDSLAGTLREWQHDDCLGPRDPHRSLHKRDTEAEGHLPSSLEEVVNEDGVAQEHEETLQHAEIGRRTNTHAGQVGSLAASARYLRRAQDVGQYQSGMPIQRWF